MTYKGDVDRDPRSNSDEKIQSKGGDAIVDLPLVMDSDYSSQEIDRIIKVCDRYDRMIPFVILILMNFAKSLNPVLEYGLF